MDPENQVICGITKDFSPIDFSEEAASILYRRQFILGSRSWAERFQHWNRTPIGSIAWLATHPDLSVAHAQKNDFRAWLLGFLLDPDAPGRREKAILEEILDISCLEQVPERFDRLGGRWAVIVLRGEQCIFFSDPAGYRQICYSDAQQVGELVCASQPGLLAQGLGVKESREARSFREEVFPRKSQYWWPGDTTPYREIRHLPPNHYLDLRTGKRTRFWPKRPLTHRSLTEAIEASAPLLTGIWKAAHGRFLLALSVTAGRDSRLNLACSRKIRNDVFYFTQKYWSLSKSSPDVRIPRRLLKRLGVTHHLLSAPETMAPGLARHYFESVEFARPVYGPLAQGLREGLPTNAVLVKGNLISVGKGSYKKRALEKGIDPDHPRAADISGISLMGKNHSFARKAYREWLRGARDRHGVDLLDLLLWEDREGRWQAMSQLEWDLAAETLVPFNCRAFLEIMLSVDFSERCGPAYLFHEELIRRLWPEALAEPFNPPDVSPRKFQRVVKRRMRGFLQEKGVYDHLPEFAKNGARRLFRF